MRGVLAGVGMSGVSMPSMSPYFVRFGDISRCSDVGGQFESRPEHQIVRCAIPSETWDFFCLLSA